MVGKWLNYFNQESSFQVSILLFSVIIGAYFLSEENFLRFIFITFGSKFEAFQQVVLHSIENRWNIF